MTPTKFFQTAVIAFVVVLLICAFVSVCEVKAQTPTPPPIVVPFPTNPIGNNPANPGNPVVAMNAGKPTNPVAGGGYSGSLIVPMLQWGPGLSDGVRAIWGDVISCSECSGGAGGRYLAGRCDSHEGVSMVFVSSPQPSGIFNRVLSAIGLSTPADTYIIADNYLASQACNLGPRGQLYKIHNGVATWVNGFDANIQKFVGFKGTNAYLLGHPYQVLDCTTGALVDGQPSGFPYDAKQFADSGGRVWTVSVIPNGIQTKGGGPTPPPPPTPTAVPSLTPTATGTGKPSATSTPATGSPTPTPQFVCVTVTPHP